MSQLDTKFTIWISQTHKKFEPYNQNPAAKSQPLHQNTICLRMNHEKDPFFELHIWNPEPNFSTMAKVDIEIKNCHWLSENVWTPSQCSPPSSDKADLIVEGEGHPNGKKKLNFFFHIYKQHFFFAISSFARVEKMDSTSFPQPLVTKIDGWG